MKILATLFILMFAGAVNAQLIDAGKPNIYVGQTFTAASASADAVNVNRYDTVYFIGCTFNGLLRGSGGSNLKVVGCIFNGVQPTANEQWNRAIDVNTPQAFYAEYNVFNSHTGGIRVDHRNQNTRSIIIRHNRFYNIDARYGNGNYNPSQQKAAILIDGCVGIGGEISWNYIQNLPDSSCVEDNINLRNSGGYAGTPYRIHHNYIDGAYSYPVSLTSIPSVSGITAEAGDEYRYSLDSSDATLSKTGAVSQWIQIDSNRIVRCMNGGINMTSTHDVNSLGNTVISSGRLPDGRQSFAFWSALAIWNGSSLPATTWRNNSQKNNFIAVVRPGSTNGGIDRNDTSTPETIADSDNTHLPNPITKATEDSQLALWIADTLRAAGKAPASPVTNTVAYKASFIIGNVSVGIDSTTGVITGGFRFVVDANGDSTTYQTGSVTYTSSDPNVATVAAYATAENRFYITPLRPGMVTITAAARSEIGAVVSSTFTVTLVRKYREAVGFKIYVDGAR